jgi:hypothetical protein
MFYHSYDSYLKYAYPYDELRPLTCDGWEWIYLKRKSVFFCFILVMIHGEGKKINKLNIFLRISFVFVII